MSCWLMARLRGRCVRNPVQGRGGSRALPEPGPLPPASPRRARPGANLSERWLVGPLFQSDGSTPHAGDGHMSEKQRDHDSEEGLQEELRRESAELTGAVGDIAEDRNVSGSSSWTTLPEKPTE